VTTHELVEAERTSNRVVIMNRGHVVIEGSLDELAGDPEMIVELSASVDPTELATRLDCVVTDDGAHRYRCATVSTPERLADLNAYLTSVGVTLTSLRTRASLEERYLELIEEERRAVRP
jgi:ABC-2 type transport system ATP-binding protein